jgi:hypothetical protein
MNMAIDYIGLRAIRVVTVRFFEFLGLAPMLQRERARATERLRRKAMQMNKKLTDLMRRASQGIRKMFTLPLQLSQANRERREANSLCWNMLCAKYMQAGLEPEECRRQTNAELGLPADYSPGRRA